MKRQCPEVDFICRGDGEQLILDLVERIWRTPGVASVTWMKDGKVVHNPNRVIERHLDQWPFRIARVSSSTSSNRCRSMYPAVLSMERFTTMQTSRGCPWPCMFCDIPIFNEGKWRSRSPQHVVAEFKHLAGTRLWGRLFRRRPFPAPAKANRGDLQRIDRGRAAPSNGDAKGAWIRSRSICSRPWRRPIAGR